MIFSLPFGELSTAMRFRSRGRTVTEADVVAFAALTGDWHPLHTDAQWAAEGPFGRRIAHGLLVVSIAAGLLAIDPERVVALRRISDVVFRRPVAPGDTIRVDGRIVRLRAATDEAGLVTVALDVVRNDERRACSLKLELLWRTDLTQTPADPVGEMVWQDA